MSNLPEQNWSIVLGSIKKNLIVFGFTMRKMGTSLLKVQRESVSIGYMKVPVLWKEVSKVKKVCQMNKNYCVETIVKFCLCKSQISFLLDRYTPGSGLVQLSCLSMWPEMMSQ